MKDKNKNALIFEMLLKNDANDDSFMKLSGKFMGRYYDLEEFIDERRLISVPKPNRVSSVEFSGYPKELFSLFATIIANNNLKNINTAIDNANMSQLKDINQILKLIDIDVNVASFPKFKQISDKLDTNQTSTKINTDLTADEINQIKNDNFKFVSSEHIAEELYLYINQYNKDHNNYLSTKGEFMGGLIDIKEALVDGKLYNYLDKDTPQINISYKGLLYMTNKGETPELQHDLAQYTLDEMKNTRDAMLKVFGSKLAKLGKGDWTQVKFKLLAEAIKYFEDNGSNKFKLNPRYSDRIIGSTQLQPQPQPKPKPQPQPQPKPQPTEQQIIKRASQIWVNKGSPQNQTLEQQKSDYNEAKRQLILELNSQPKPQPQPQPQPYQFRTPNKYQLDNMILRLRNEYKYHEIDVTDEFLEDEAKKKLKNKLNYPDAKDVLARLKKDKISLLEAEKRIVAERGLEFDANQQSYGIENYTPKTGTGVGRPRKNNPQYAMSKGGGGRFGNLFIDPKSLNTLRLKVHRGGSLRSPKILDTIIDNEMFDLVTKRFNPKKKYKESNLQMFQDLLKLSEIPITKMHSKKRELVSGKGIKFYQDHKELFNRLKLLMSAWEAGSKSADVFNEVNEIVDVLRKKGKVSSAEAKQLCGAFPA